MKAIKLSKFDSIYKKVDRALAKMADCRAEVAALRQAHCDGRVRVLNVPKERDFEMRKIWTLFDDLNWAIDTITKANRAVERVIDGVAS